MTSIYQAKLITDLEAVREFIAGMATQIISPGHMREALEARAAVVAQAVETLTIIERLREDEADQVTLVSDNADFNGQPNCLVICCGDWTDYQDHRFEGDTIIECLRAALDARNAASSAAH